MDRSKGGSIGDCKDRSTVSSRYHYRFGPSLVVVTDNGTHFLGEFDELCKKMHIQHRFATPYYPQKMSVYTGFFLIETGAGSWMILRIGMSEPFSATINKCEIDFRVWRRDAVQDASLANNMSRKLVRSRWDFRRQFEGDPGSIRGQNGGDTMRRVSGDSLKDSAPAGDVRPSLGGNLWQSTC